MRTRYTIAAGSGIGSGRECFIVSWNDPRVRQMRDDYPFVAVRTPQSMGWVAVEFKDGTLSTYPKNRLHDDTFFGLHRRFNRSN